MTSERIKAFVSSPLFLSNSASSSWISGSTCNGMFSKTPFYKHGCSQRARFVALGATPSPPPKEPEEDEEQADVSEPASTSPSNAEEETVEEVTADDILNSPSFLKKKLELVQKELIELKSTKESDSEAVKEEKNRYVRLVADFENYRRRSVEDLRKQDAKSTAKVCEELLQVLDNFERANAAVNVETDKEKSIVSSYQAINRQLLDALTKLKVEPIDAIGNVFDPEIHEAIQKTESEEYKEDVVCQQFQRGYRIGDTLIRAAIVAVSTGPGPEGEDDDNGGESGESEVEEAVSVNASPVEGDEEENGPPKVTE